MFPLTSTNSMLRHQNGRPSAIPAVAPHPSDTRITVRRATPADARAVRLIAALDDRRLGRGPHFVAEADGEIVAALSSTDRTVVADPFRRTAHLVALLELRAAQLAETTEPAARDTRAAAGAFRPAAA